MASISPRGDGWRAMVRRLGQSHTQTFSTEKEAREWATKLEADIVYGVSVPEIKQAASDPRVTVEALFNRYAKEVSPEKGGYVSEKYRLARLAMHFPDMAAVNLDGSALAEWRDQRLTEVSASTVNRELGLIGSVLTRAMREWRLPITVNPAHVISHPKEAPSRTRRVSDEEREAVVAQLGWNKVSQPTTKREWVAWSFCFALETMMRQGEILRLTWPHVHIDKKFCHLPKTKNGDKRDVPLSSRSIALIKLLTPSTGRVVAMVPHTFKCIFREAVAEAKVNDLHFHDARREALTRTAEKLPNIAELARASGHRGTRSLMVYYHPDVTDIANKLD